MIQVELNFKKGQLSYLIPMIIITKYWTFGLDILEFCLEPI
jgi:hypothetical protein